MEMDELHELVSWLIGTGLVNSCGRYQRLVDDFLAYLDEDD